MKTYIDCPLCGVFMKQKDKSGYSFTCPLCGSRFLVNRKPDKPGPFCWAASVKRAIAERRLREHQS